MEYASGGYLGSKEARGVGSYPSAQQADAPPESPSRIRDGIGQTEQTLSAIHEAITALEKRFDTVLRPQPPQVLTNSANAKTGPVCSHVTGRLDILNEGFQQALSRLHELAGRAEV